MKRIMSLCVALVLVTSNPTISASAEDCPTYDLEKVFYDEFYPDLRWATDANREITWSAEVTEVEGSPVDGAFSDAQRQWLRLSFNSWDMTSDKIKFREVGKDSNPDVRVGLVTLADPNNHGFWNIKKSAIYRGSGSIRINSKSRFIVEKDYFMEVVQSEIGNLLGLGDIRDSAGVDSVMMDPDLPPWGSYPLSDYDIGLIRTFYQESTCASSWPVELKSLKNLKAQELKAAEEATLREKAAEEERKKAEAELAAKLAAQSATASPSPAVTTRSTSKRTITCIKGKVTRKITGVAPKCPAGFKRK